MRGFVIPSIYTVVDKFTAPVKAMGNTAANFANQAQAGVARLDRGLNKMLPSLGGATKQFLSFASAAAISAAVFGTISFGANSLIEYEKALASAQAVTGTSNKDFVKFKAQIMDVAKQTKKSAVDVAKAFELIGSAKPELLKDAEGLGAVTKAAITLSKASGDDLAMTVESLTGTMNQFSAGAKDADKFINVLSAGAQAGAASIGNISESMKNFGSVAVGANLSIEQTVALIETVGEKGLFGAEAGTKLRGSILKLQQAGVGYASGQFNVADALEETRQKMLKLKTAKQQDALLNKVFGAENISTGRILLNNIDKYKEFTKAVTGTQSAQEMAAIRSKTFSNAIEELKAAFVNTIVESGFLQKAVGKLTSIMRWAADNMESIIFWGKILIGTFLALKTVIFAVNFITNVWAAGVKIVTAVQWAWNAAMMANPIVIFLITLGALIALIAIVITKFNEWGAALSFVFPIVGLIVNAIQSFRRNWDGIISAFKNNGILAGIKKIGAAIFDIILMPLQQIIDIVANLSGFEWAENAAKNLKQFRADIGANVTTDASGEALAKPVNPKAEEGAGFVSALTAAMKRGQQNVNIKIKDETGRAEMESDSSAVPITLTSTMRGVY